MKPVISILAVLALVAGVSTTMTLPVSAATAAPATQAVKPTRGQITKIDGDKVTIVSGRNKTEKVITITDKTTITIDKETKTKADLKVDLYVTVTLDGDNATKIVATTAKPTRGGAAPAGN